MSQNDSKPWERPWSTQEMIENAPNWNLAGDCGLLKYLEDFSEKMISKVKDTNERLNDLIDNTDATSLSLQNATNEFMGLRNTQFIESRVYEDDETLPTKQTPEKEEKTKPTEAERLEEMKQAICNGLDIIDKYYEKVVIPESDSDDETDGPNILYRPVDPYIDRPLPYVIGNYQWYKYWHVGLEPSSSDSEEEKEVEQYSETESEQEVIYLPERDHTQIPGISDSESEDLPKNKMAKPVANSTFNDNTNRNMFDSSSDSETGSLPAQVNTINNNFAEKLAKKLGMVEANIQSEVNTKPIKKPPSNITGGLFSDEPPPLDDDDIFVKKNMSSGLFSSGDNLFDDVDDDNDFWNVKGPSKNTTTAVFESKKSKENLFADEDDQDIFSNKPIEKVPEPKQFKKPTGLFDEDDDDLFSTATLTQQPRRTILTPFKTTAPLLSDEPPELESSAPKISEEVIKKKPVGGVSIFGPNTVIQQHIRKTHLSSSSEYESDFKPPKPEPKEELKKEETKKEETKKEELKKEEVKKEETKTLEPSKISSIFDDTSPLFSDDIFNTSSTKKFTSKLFDPEPMNDDALFEVEDKKVEEKEKIQGINTIDDNKTNLFVEEPPPISSQPKSATLFVNEDEEDIFSSKSKQEQENPNTKSSRLFSKTSGSFFDDLGDELFSTKLNIPTTSKSKVDLFDPNPPDLEESDNKSESHSQLSLENEPISYGTMNSGRASLFDTEPPLLSNESSGIVRDQSNSRFEGEDSSFHPFASSSRRHSNLFQDQGDSLLTGKTKLSVANDTNPLLSKVTENTMTKIDITPSGNESSLLDNAADITSASNKDEEIKTNKTDDIFKNKSESSNIFKEPKIENQNLFSERKAKKKDISLFGESDSEDDLFSNKSSGSKNSSASDILNNSSKSAKTLKNKNIFEDDLFSGPNINVVPEVDIFNKNKNMENSSSDEFNNTKSVSDKNEEDKIETKKFNYEENLKSDEVKTDPKKSLSFEKNVEPNKEDIEPKQNESDGQILSAGSSPGKIKHNLNINVAALLPGAPPPRKQNLEKSTSLDSSESNQTAPIEEKTKSSEKISVPKPSIEKSISFDQPVNTEEILISANKERAKIPVRRRPSTRRARQEAIRKSAMDLNYEDAIKENGKSVNESPPDKIETQNKLNIANNNISKTEDKMKNSLLNPLSPSTDEEDFLTMPRDKVLSSENFKDSLFGNAPIISPVDLLITQDENKKNIQTHESDDLFDVIKPPKEDHCKKEEISKTKGLFDDEEDIFSSNKKEVKPKKIDSSIFSSSDSENDLFSTPKTELKKPDNNNLIASPDEELFKPIVSTRSSNQPTRFLQRDDSLFDEDDIFSTKKIPPKSVIIKRSLFDDDDDNDDDIFGGSSTVTSKPTPQTQSTAVKKTPAPSRLKKLSSDTMQDIDDPLEALKK